MPQTKLQLLREAATRLRRAEACIAQVDDATEAWDLTLNELKLALTRAGDWLDEALASAEEDDEKE